MDCIFKSNVIYIYIYSRKRNEFDENDEQIKKKRMELLYCKIIQNLHCDL